MTTETPVEKEQTGPQFGLQKVYVKDLSFESPKPAEYFSKPLSGPNINMQLNTETQQLQEGVYEVVLNITVTATAKDDEKNTLYLAEVKQAGIFALSNFGEQELAAMVNSFCPNILFPYAREAISNMVERGGFPQLLLAPINFDALYQQHLNKLKEAAETPSAAKH